MHHIADNAATTRNVRYTYEGTLHAPSLMEGASQKTIDVEIVSTVANKENKDPVYLPPLYDELDPEALERLTSTA